MERGSIRDQNAGAVADLQGGAFLERDPDGVAGFHLKGFEHGAVVAEDLDLSIDDIAIPQRYLALIVGIMVAWFRKNLFETAIMCCLTVLIIEFIF